MTKKLKMAVRMAIIPEISKQNYDTLAKQFREVIANAYDAGATEIRIDVRNVGNRTDLIFEDNGHGMTDVEFERDYLGVGGSWKIDDINTIGRIGIGSLAVAVLGKRVLIETRKVGTNKVVVAELWIGETVNNINSDRSAEVKDIEVGQIVEIRKANKNDPAHFTRIHLLEVIPDTERILNDKDRLKKVINELERILPLRYPDEHPLYKQWAAALRELLIEGDRLRTIDVLIAAPCIGNDYYSLQRYVYGHESREDERIEGYPHSILLEEVKGGVNSNLCIYGYLVDAGKQLPDELQGLVVRVKNMGVELNSYFESGDAAANLRITGELFIENLDEPNAMTINRNELVKDHGDYVAIQKTMEPILNAFVKLVRGRVEINSQIKKQVKRASGVRQAILQVGTAIGDIGLEIDDCAQEQTDYLSSAPNVDVKSEIRELGDQICVYELDLDATHDIKHQDDQVQVTLQRDLLENKVTIGMDEFTYYLKKGDPEAPPCEIHKDSMEIYLNMNHPILESRGDQIIRAVIALRFAYLRANGDAEKLYESTLEILGSAFKK